MVSTGFYIFDIVYCIQQSFFQHHVSISMNTTQHQRPGQAKQNKELTGAQKCKDRFLGGNFSHPSRLKVNFFWSFRTFRAFSEAQHYDYFRILNLMAVILIYHFINFNVII